MTQEQVCVVRGSVIGGGKWGPLNQQPDGTFGDYVGLSAPWNKEAIQCQTFTATMLNLEEFAPGVPRPVMVYYPGYGDELFGTMGHWMTLDGVRTNNYWYPPWQSGRTVCDDEPRMGGI